MLVSKKDLISGCAKAIFTVAKAQQHVEQCHAQLKTLKVVLTKPETLTFFLSYEISKIQKEKVLQTIWTKTYFHPLYEFCWYLICHRNLQFLGDIFEAFEQLMLEEHLVHKATITTKFSIPKATLDKIKLVLQKTFAYPKLELANIVDQSLSGGVIINVDDQIIDYSHERQLQNLTHAIFQ